MSASHGDSKVLNLEGERRKETFSKHSREELSVFLRAMWPSSLRVCIGACGDSQD